MPLKTYTDECIRGQSRVTHDRNKCQGYEAAEIGTSVEKTRRICTPHTLPCVDE